MFHYRQPAILLNILHFRQQVILLKMLHSTQQIIPLKVFHFRQQVIPQKILHFRQVILLKILHSSQQIIPLKVFSKTNLVNCDNYKKKDRWICTNNKTGKLLGTRRGRHQQQIHQHCDYSLSSHERKINNSAVDKMIRFNSSGQSNQHVEKIYQNKFNKYK